MARMRTLLIMLTVLALLAVTASTQKAAMNKQKTVAQQDIAKDIKVTIATVSPMLDGDTSTYRVGQQIPIAINLTNTTKEPIYSCLSGDLYQDLPELKRNGQLVPYTPWQSYVLQWVKNNQTCLNDDLPSDFLLPPNKPTVVDSLFLVDYSSNPIGAVAWYDQLQPGKYELSIKRRFGCCDGPMIESNTVGFEITP